MSDFQLYIQVNHLSLNFILNNHFYAPGIEVMDSLCFPVYKCLCLRSCYICFSLTLSPVLTAYEYDHRSPNSPKGGKSKGAKLVSTRPPATTGIIRPRKTPLGSKSLVSSLYW